MKVSINCQPEIGKHYSEGMKGCQCREEVFKRLLRAAKEARLAYALLLDSLTEEEEAQMRDLPKRRDRLDSAVAEAEEILK